MQPDRYRQFADFARFDREALTSLDRHVRELRLPSGRTLLREGRHLPGHYYLLAGAVRIGPPDCVVRAGSSQARQRIYPGSRTITTVEPSTLMYVDWEQARFLEEIAGALRSPPDEGWQERFLLSPMMRRTCPSEWRSILSELELRSLIRGQRVIEEGSAADGCFVLRTGHAVVHAGRHTFAYLMPGDFFGEDALVTGRVRNASVTMIEAGSVLRMPEEMFRRMVLEPVVSRVRAAGRGVLVNAGVNRIEGTVQVSLRWLRQQLRRLDRSRPHYVVGGGDEERSLAALILIQAGFDAAAVLD